MARSPARPLSSSVPSISNRISAGFIHEPNSFFEASPGARSSPVAGTSSSRWPPIAFASTSSAVIAISARPRDCATRARSAPNAATVSRGSAADGCSAISIFGSSASARARCTRICMSGGTCPRAGRTASASMPDIARQRAGLRHHARIDRIDIERERHRDVLQHRERLDQDAARRDHADAVERLQPRVAVGDAAGVAAEQHDVALVRAASRR